MTYEEFINSKVQIAPKTGFDVADEEICTNLKPHQKIAVKWAIAGGRRAIFANFGLGKTVIQLEILHLITQHKGGKALIVAPFDVMPEFDNDAVNILKIAPPVFIRSNEEVKNNDSMLFITNYESVREGKVDVKQFTATSLDEASVLRSFGSKTYQSFLDMFKGVKYKFVNTATPSPNRYKELIHYGGYLEIMDTGQALTRFFKRDSTKANNLTLYPKREKEFWLWLASWALFVTKPSDLGFSDEGYILPPMHINKHIVKSVYEEAPCEKDGQTKLLLDTNNSLVEEAKEKKLSIKARVAKAKEIIEANPNDHFIIWHDREEERKEIKRTIQGVVDIYGSMDMEIRRQRLVDFAEGRTKLFATKKCISGSGCNFQKACHRAIFVGIDHKFNDFIQAVHRIYRFLQTEDVIIDIIFTDAEEAVYQDLMAKWKRHNELQETMSKIIKDYGLNIEYANIMTRAKGVERVKVEGENYTAILNDCVKETINMSDNSVDLICTSIPFGNHYEYSANYNDFGHNENDDKFFEQMDYLSSQLLRVLKPGRVFACHIKDRVLFGNATGTGMPTIEPFHADAIKHYMRHGFQYMGMITVVTDVVRENNQTYRLGWTENCKDGTKMGVGCPEYILLFRKLPTDTSKAYADRPVEKDKEKYTRGQWQIDAHAFWRSSGDRLLSKDELKNIEVGKLTKIYRDFSRNNVYNYDEHIKLANDLDKEGKLPAAFMVIAPGSWDMSVWDDINRMRTLNTTQCQRNKEMHICPLQLDIVERIINRFSAENETVYDPFGGLMTVPYMAVKMHRYGIGCELSPDYFRDGVGYLQEAENTVEMPTLFDFVV